MWISAQKTGHSKEDSPLCGEITHAQGGKVAVQCAGEYRDVPVLAPAGVAWVPQRGQESVLLPLAGGAVCAGVLAPDKGLQPGELMLFSAGGASIVLKNNGEVLINGTKVAAFKEGL